VRFARAVAKKKKKKVRSRYSEDPINGPELSMLFDILRGFWGRGGGGSAQGTTPTCRAVAAG
jgi:hypothetical protein